MNIGKLSQRIIFKQLVLSVNENGFEQEQWLDYKATWAKVDTLYGREYWNAATIKAENTLKVIIRYDENINNKMRILYQNKLYNITFINNIDNKCKYLELKMIEI